MQAKPKLVRDKIPDIIRSHGETPVFSILDNKQVLPALEQKLDEEVAEYHESGEIEELADILEVIYTIAAKKGFTQTMLENLRLSKGIRRGGFEKGIFLEDVQVPVRILYYEVGIETPEVLGSGSSYSNVLQTKSEEEAFQLLQQGRNYLVRYARENGKLVVDEFDPVLKTWNRK